MSTIPTQPIATRSSPAQPRPRAQTNSPPFGRLLFQARPSKPGWADFTLLLLPGVLVVFASLGYAFWLWISAYQRFGPVAALAWATPWYLLAALALLFFLLVCLYRLVLARRFLAIYENGLQARLSPLRQVTMAWDEITGLSAGSIQDQFLRLSLRNNPTARLYRRRGAPLRLPGSWGKLHEAIPILKARLYPLLMPGLQAEFQSGHGASFGRLTLYPEALRLAGKAIPWTQVARLRVHSGYLLVETFEKRPLRLPVVEIPNLELLLQLVDWGINSQPNSEPSENTLP